MLVLACLTPILVIALGNVLALALSLALPLAGAATGTDVVSMTSDPYKQSTTRDCKTKAIVPAVVLELHSHMCGAECAA